MEFTAHITGSNAPREHFILSLLRNGSTVVLAGRRRVRRFVVGSREMVSNHHEAFALNGLVHVSVQVRQKLQERLSNRSPRRPVPNPSHVRLHAPRIALHADIQALHCRGCSFRWGFHHRHRCNVHAGPRCGANYPGTHGQVLFRVDLGRK